MVNYCFDCNKIEVNATLKNLMFNTILKNQNNLMAGVDVELANDFKKAFLKLNKTDSLFKKNKLYNESIFLDLTDRTECHPRTSFKTEDRGGLLGGIVKSFGMGNQKVVWELDARFDTEYYFSINWFDNLLDMHLEFKKN